MVEDFTLLRVKCDFTISGSVPFFQTYIELLNLFRNNTLLQDLLEFLLMYAFFFDFRC